MQSQEWKEFCRIAWINGFDNLQTARFAKIGEGIYTIRSCYKTINLECTPETKLYQFSYINLIYSIKNKHDIEHLEELEFVQWKVKYSRLVEKLGKQGFHQDLKELFEPIKNSHRYQPKLTRGE